MKSTIKRRGIIVGLFLFIGLIILMTGILTIGNLHNSFVKKFEISATFDEVSGLQAGNNIWFSGVKVGTVSSLNFCKKSQVKVGMKIDQAARTYIRKDAKAKIASDGLIGNKIIVIYEGSESALPVQNGDTLAIGKTLSTDDMMKTLQENNKNLVAITGDFKEISKKILAGEGTLGKLLTDETLYDNVNLTVATLKSAALNAEKLTASLSIYTTKMNQEGSLTNNLVTDTTLFNSIKATVAQLKDIAKAASGITANLKLATGDLNNTNTPVGVLLHDQPAATDIKSTIKNLESSTQKLNEDLEALQHNFLLRGYFKKKK